MILPSLGVLAIFGPLTFFFAAATVEGEVRRKETPIRALVGDEAFEAMRSGQPTEQHYMGNNRSVPDFTLQDRNGRTVSFSELRSQALRGKTIVLNFWTVTCQPCLEEMPSLLELASLGKRSGDFAVVSISTDRNRDDINAVIPESSDMMVLHDPDKRVVNGLFGTRLYPETWIIDPNGIIRLRVDGGRDWSNALTHEVLSNMKQ